MIGKPVKHNLSTITNAKKIQSLQNNKKISSNWYIKTTVIGEDHCTTVIEEETGYGMYFFNLNPQDHENFDKVWKLRMVAEAMSVCDLDFVQTETLKHKLLKTMPNKLFEVHTTQNIPSHINQKLELYHQFATRLLHKEGAIPKDDAGEFVWGSIVNSTDLAGNSFDFMRKKWLLLLNEETQIEKGNRLTLEQLQENYNLAPNHKNLTLH